MSISKDIESLLNEFGLKLVKDTKSNLRKKLDERSIQRNRKKVVSRLEQSVNKEVYYKDGAIHVKIIMNDYYEFVDGGRKAGNVSAEGQNKLAEWSHTRGIAEKIRLNDFDLRTKIQNDAKAKNANRKKWTKLKKMPFDRAKKAAGFLLARTLKNQDIEPTHFFSEIVNDGRIEELEKRIADIFKTDIKIEISKA